MADYAYVALDSRGVEARGALHVESLGEACKRLKEMGLFPTKVVEKVAKPRFRTPRDHASTSLSKPARAQSRRSWFGRGVKPRSLAAFTRQMATLLAAGMPLLRGLRLLEEQENQGTFKRVLQETLSGIESGSSLSESFAKNPKVFNSLYLNMVRAGEVSGSLEVVLRRLAEFLEKSERIKHKVLAALYYPAAVLVVTFGVAIGLMVWIVPKFRQVFAELMGADRLPPFTQAVLNISEIVRSHFFSAMISFIAVGLLLKFVASTDYGRAFFDRFKLRMPLLGPVFSKAAIGRFTRTLGTLMGSGVPVLQALTIVKETAGNVVIKRAISRVHESVKEGDSIAAPLKASAVFPAVMVGLVDVGEQTGALPDMLTKIADINDEEVDNAVAGMSSLLEPILILILAVIVGTIVIAMFLPIIWLIYHGVDGQQGAGI